MSRYFKLLILLLIVSIFFSACDPCGYLECATGNSQVKFKFISAATGRNLVFGPNKIYDTTQVKFFATRGRDTTFFKPYIYYDNAGFNDTALQIEFYLNNTAYIKFGNTDIDTITFSLEKYDTKCCKNQTDVTGVRYNNAFQLMPNKGVLEIMK